MAGPIGQVAFDIEKYKADILKMRMGKLES